MDKVMVLQLSTLIGVSGSGAKGVVIDWNSDRNEDFGELLESRDMIRL
jgi:hypothetical protein